MPQVKEEKQLIKIEGEQEKEKEKVLEKEIQEESLDDMLKALHGPK
jgi:hypothetical protein